MNREELIAKWNDPQKVLDHGHIRLIDVMGNDGSIVQAARVSYGKGLSEHKWTENVVHIDGKLVPAPREDGEKTGPCSVCGFGHSSGYGQPPASYNHCPEGDRRLIRYLMSVRHTTPFEQCEIKLHVKLPIFVARQWIRHRTANVNEMSGRYKMLPDEFYIPEASRVGGKGKGNKQGTEDELDARKVMIFRGEVDNSYRHMRRHYEHATEDGIANELARFHTGVNQYTEWYWKIDLHNLLHFISLRMDSHAQYEIRVYADLLWDIIKDWVPFAAEAFVDYRFEAAMFSRQQLDLLRHLMNHLIAADELAGVDSSLNNRDVRKGLCDRFDVGTTRERAHLWRKLGVIE